MSEVVKRPLFDVLQPPISGSRPKGGVSTETDGVPSLGGENILSSGGVTYDVIKRITQRFFDSIPKGKLCGGDVLINKDGAQTGKVGYYIGDLFDEAAINEHLFILRGLTDYIIEQSYLYYALLLPVTHQEIERRITGSAQPGLNSCFVKAVSIPYHPINVQKDISCILRTIDRAIEKTETLIAKYQQVKAGLMHDLFTRGVTADGKLRPSCEQAPELYKETPIGWIPREWECKTLEQLLAPVGNNLRSGPFGSALLKDELVEEGITFLGIDNIYTEHFEAKYRRFLSQKKFMELHRYSVRPKDVVITIMGTVGRCCVLPDDIGQALSSKHLWTMTLDQSQVFPELVCWQLNYAPWVLSWLRSKGVARGCHGCNSIVNIEDLAITCSENVGARRNSRYIPCFYLEN